MLLLMNILCIIDYNYVAADVPDDSHRCQCNKSDDHNNEMNMVNNYNTE